MNMEAVLLTFILAAGMGWGTYLTKQLNNVNAELRAVKDVKDALLALKDVEIAGLKRELLEVKALVVELRTQLSVYTREGG